MSSDSDANNSDQRSSNSRSASDDGRDNRNTPSDAPSGQSSREKDAKDKDKPVLDAKKVEMQSHLPSLEDAAETGLQKEQIVTRDGKADIGFCGVLLASAAPNSAPKGQWQEYRIYQTNGGKHVFSKIARNVAADSEDTHEAEIFDPAPSSMPSQLLKSAREIVHAKPTTWMDAAVAFFGYDPLAKELYRKLSVKFEEQID